MLGPVHFLLYINDIKKSSLILSFFLFADDASALLIIKKDIKSTLLIIKKDLKDALSGLRQFLAIESSLPMMKNSFLFHLKNSFCSQDI